jgi:tetratricopeptide (TPR) repeat protein
LLFSFKRLDDGNVLRIRELVYLYTKFASIMTNKVFFVLLLVLAIGCSNRNDVAKLKFLERGNLAYQSKEYIKATGYYTEAIMIDSTFVDAWNNKGLSLMMQSRYDEAIYCFDQAIQHKPEYGEATLNNAKANLAVKQYFAAADHVNNLKNIWPDTSLVFFTEGLIYAATGENNKAKDAFQKVLDLEPTHSEAMVNIANLYYHNMKSDSAIIILKNAVKINPDLSNAYNILAMVHAQLEQYDSALLAIDTAISLNKDDAYYINNKGYILLKLDKLDLAEENIVISMKIDPYNGWVYRNLGLIRYAQKNNKEAVRLLEKALKIDTEIDHIYYDMAVIYHEMGELAKACELLDSAPKHDENEYLRMLWCE